MYNSNGQLVFQQLVDADRGRNELQIKTGVLSPGVYHLRLFNDSQSESSQVVIK
ncbi:MAG: T9SS type A sorting domain-containing protein [Bacteroidota bacterium]